jgi:hypothetical protein
MMEDTLKILAKGRNGKLIRELLEEVKRKVADIRTPLKIKREIENEVRLGVIECLDIFLVEPLKVASGVVEPQDANEFI